MILHHDADATRLGVLRIAVFGWWFVLVARAPVDLYARLPPELWDARGLLGLLPVEVIVASPGALLAVKGTALVLCALCVLGVRPWVPIAGSTAVLVVLFDALAKGLGGYTNHAQAVLILVTALLVIFPAADAVSVRRTGPVDRDPLVHASAMVLAVLALTTSYTFIGVRRLVTGGSEVFTGDSLQIWLVGLSQLHGPVDFDLGLRVLDHRWLLTVLGIGFLVVTVAEVVSPLVLRWDVVRRTWLAVMVGFHLGSVVTMRIVFAEHLLLMVVLLTAWWSPAPAGEGWWRRPGTRVRGPRSPEAAPVPPPG